MKKRFVLSGMLVSVLFVLMGLLVLCSAFGGDASYPSSASYAYDSGYATFGADFYNYVTNNAAEAASACRTAANNVRELCDLLKNVCGISMMGFGLLSLCFFGFLLDKANATTATEAVAPEGVVTSADAEFPTVANDFADVETAAEPVVDAEADVAPLEPTAPETEE